MKVGFFVVVGGENNLHVYFQLLFKANLLAWDSLMENINYHLQQKNNHNQNENQKYWEKLKKKRKEKKHPRNPEMLIKS